MCLGLFRETCTLCGEVELSKCLENWCNLDYNPFFTEKRGSTTPLHHPRVLS